MVARRRHLPGLPAVVRRLRRGRHRRPAGRRRPPRPPGRARRRRGLAVAVLPVAAGRRRLRRGRLPRRRPAVRHARRRRQADRRGARPRPAGDRRPGAEPHLVDEHRVVPGGAGRGSRAAASATATSSATGGPTVARRTAGRACSAAAAWTQVADGQWYLHLFDVGQPDLNWDNPEVRAEFEDILRFWLDRGVDGFRVDVAHGLVKQADLADWHLPMVPLTGAGVEGAPRAADVGPGRRARDLPRAGGRSSTATRATGSWSPRRGCSRPSGWPAYVRPDEMHQAFNFEYLEASVDGGRPAIGDRALAGRRRGRRRADHLGAVQPRRGAARVPPRPAGRRAPRPTASAPATRSPTPGWACAGPGPRPC